jgi:peptide/nickel transport system permease protein
MRAWEYLIRRLVLLIPFALLLSLLTFTLSRVVPADPVALAAGRFATEEMRETLRREFQLDRPLAEQYVAYMTGLLRGDMGRSLLSRRPVLEDIQRYLPATIELSVFAIVIALALGVPAGMISAQFRDRAPDHLARIFSLMGVSFPNFWLGLMLQLLLAVGLSMLPLGGRFDTGVAPPPHVTGLFLVDSLLARDPGAFIVSLKHLILPAFVESVAALATIARMTRSGMIDARNQDFVLTARASGMPEIAVLFRHMLRYAITPVLTMTGLFFAWMLGGSILVETIFDWPGLGYYTVEATLVLDYQPLMGVTLIYGLSCGLVNILVDILYGVVDPRVRYG